VWSARSLRVDASGTVRAGVDGEAVTLTVSGSAVTPALSFLGLCSYKRAAISRLVPRPLPLGAF
jgi:hypothetical protein